MLRINYLKYIIILIMLLTFNLSLQLSYSQDEDIDDEDLSEIDDEDIGDVGEGEGEIPEDILNSGTKEDSKNKSDKDSKTSKKSYMLDEYHKKIYQSKNKKRFTIDATIDYIVKNSPEIKEAEWGIKYYQGLRTQADGAMAPKLYIQSFVAPTPEIVGNTQKSEIPDFWDFEKWGYYYRLDATLLQPVYTFDRISSAQRAATKGIEVAKADRDEIRWQVINRAKELYYGHLTIQTLYKNTLMFAETILEEALTFARKSFAKGDGSIKAWDIDKLEVYTGELERNKAEALKFIIFTHEALKKFLKLKDNETFIPADEEIRPLDTRIHTFEYYEKLMYKNNTLWRKVNAGADAMEALADFEVANYFPIIGIAGQFGFGYANQIDDQDSSFAYDPYNEITGGLGLGILWFFDVWSQHGLVKQAEAKHQQIVQKKAFAKDGLHVLLKEAYVDVLKYKRNIQTDADSVEAANNWMKNAFVPWQTGLAEAKDALEGVAALAIAQKNYYMSIFQYNMAIAKLSYMCGVELGKYKYGRGKAYPVNVKNK